MKGFDRRRDTNYFLAAWEMYFDLFLSDEVSASLTNLPFFEFPGKKRIGSYAFLCRDAAHTQALGKLSNACTN